MATCPVLWWNWRKIGDVDMNWATGKKPKKLKKSAISQPLAMLIYNCLHIAQVISSPWYHAALSAPYRARMASTLGSRRLKRLMKVFTWFVSLFSGTKNWKNH